MTLTSRLTRTGLAGSILCAAIVAGAPGADAAADPGTPAGTIINGFGARLQVALATSVTDANLVFSPFSVGVALTMTSAGAAGETAAQMRDVLGVGDGDPHAAVGSLIAAAQREDGTLTAANSLWTQSDLAIQTAFSDLLRDVYRSELMATDFAADPAAALAAVNEWVASNTGGRIPELLTERDVDDLTRFILVNAVHLDAIWSEPFDPASTSADIFTRGDGSAVEVDFMGQVLHAAYAGQDGTQSIVLPYEGGYEMVVVLPGAGGLAAFETALAESGGDIDATVGGFAHVDVSLRLPKWDIETRSGLVPYLRSLGMTLAFGPEADFANVTTDIPLFVGEVVHQANITVDEAGTEAAAATAVVGPAGAAPGPQPEPEVMVVDRPFFFAIRDTETGAILFQGHVNDPSAR